MKLPQSIGPELPGVSQALLGFDLPPVATTQAFLNDAVWLFTAHPVGPFLPRGLVFFGATAHTFVRRVRVGNVNEVEKSGMRVPARYFEVGRSFEQLARLAAVGELEGAVGAHQLLEMVETSPGTYLTVETEGPFDSFCMWGNVYSQGTPYLKASVERAEDDARGNTQFRGQLHEVGLAGLRTVLDVTAPDPRTAGALLAAMREGKMGRGY